MGRSKTKKYRETPKRTYLGNYDPFNDIFDHFPQILTFMTSFWPKMTIFSLFSLKMSYFDVRDPFNDTLGQYMAPFYIFFSYSKILFPSRFFLIFLEFSKNRYKNSTKKYNVFK